MDIAVGYIHETYSGLAVETEKAAIEARARTDRVELADVLILPRDEYMPFLTLYQAIHVRGATVVIVPTAEHVWVGRRGLTERVRVEIVAPPATWEIGAMWTTGTR